MPQKAGSIEALLRLPVVVYFHGIPPSTLLKQFLWDELPRAMGNFVWQHRVFRKWWTVASIHKAVGTVLENCRSHSGPIHYFTCATQHTFTLLVRVPSFLNIQACNCQGMTTLWDFYSTPWSTASLSRHGYYWRSPVGTQDLSGGHPWATNSHRTDNVGLLFVGTLIPSIVLESISVESSCRFSSSALNNSSLLSNTEVLYLWGQRA